MAIDALKNLVNNIPSWQTRLDELSSQVDKRQLELAALAEANSTKEPETRSLRNKGSVESLKPKDDGAMHIFFTEDVAPVQQQQDLATTPPQPNRQRRSSPPSPAVAKRPAFPQSSTDASGASSSRMVKKSRTTSIASADGPRQTYRTRNMIIVYYDSYVQGFFDDLVRFISSSRNLMRKAKMAAKVAQIKKLAEMDVPEDENAEGDDKATEALPSLRYISSRRYGPTAMRLGHPSLAGQAPDVFDELDKALEFVQSTCEHGAHQFLRDAKCSEEVSKIQQRIGEVLEMAKKEMERIEREEPETMKESADPKPRTMKPITVSRTLVPHHKEGDDVHSRKLEVADSAAPRLPAALHMADRIEADPNAGDDDFDTEALLARIRYTSSRQMRMRAVVN
ncbi:hypothetical protein BBK36DRAFT_1171429 [Trichoderma citrinoviride]|uniref:Uncharacterized protein n=1 Tax=Trichoderma citrinoviride TaxID=58853 RepID=A0A2T4B3U5_9HYPO|nr:hypothetical protein BBK36DRAFT_1171429 [Trichoderma citrinoviride]PTB63984.1 hypothetical protein BBK36DRAFT_1171429 [Trichoderma citrinoviride]